jgi:hypothetical protein
MPPPSLTQQEARRLALARFEARVKDLTLPGNAGPIVTVTEVELIRRKYTTVDGALAALEALAKPRLAYAGEQAGAFQPALSDAERTAGRAHFAKMRELRAEAAAGEQKAAERGGRPRSEAEAPAPKPVPADGVAAPIAEPPAPDSGYATDAITYVDRDGFSHVLTVYAPSANEALRRGRLAVKALLGMESKPPASVATAPSNGHEAGPAPVCAIHKTPMQKVQGKKGSFWSCHTKLDDGSWCPYKPPSD